MMGRIDSRFQQGKAGCNPHEHPLGGVSCVCVGDPAQCEAMFDQQLYDLEPHRSTSTGENAAAAHLSNRGLGIYAQFDDVIILTTCHRLETKKGEDLSAEDIAYNDRAQRFIELLHRLRDLEWTLEDYYWLCRRNGACSP